MKFIRIAVASLCGSLLIWGAMACQPAVDPKAMVDAMLSHPRFEEYIESRNDPEVIRAQVDAMLSHPTYQVTPEEECAATVVMAIVISGDYRPPSDAEVQELCAWYSDYLE